MQENTTILPANALQIALQHHQSGNFSQAESLYRQILQAEPHNPDALHFLGILAYQLGQYESAVALISQAIAIYPNASAMYCNLGLALQALQKWDDAVANYQQALTLRPDDSDAHYNLANTLQAQGNSAQAIRHYQHAIALKPEFALAHNNLGNALKKQGLLEEAIRSYRAAIAVKPDYAEAYNHLGITFQAQNDFDAAIEHYQQAILLNPNFADAYYNLAQVLRNLRNMESAIELYQKAILLQPERAEISDALFQAQRQICDWTDYHASREKIISAVKSAETGYTPFAFLAISASAAEQMQCAKTFANNFPLSSAPAWSGHAYQHQKIHLAYLSADFYNHATAFLMIELFELHDKSRFTLTGISFNTENDEMRHRLVRAFDHFIDVHDKKDDEVASLLQELEIDIAIDLKGYTAGARPGIFAHRAAPIQVNYLGFPGTMGADYIDYILADPHLIPPDHQIHYTEKVAYLPDSYQVNDSKRAISDYLPSRSEVNLPETGFVFCCFNNNYKITPEVFDCWMRLLNKVENSVLWLFEDNPFASYQLKKAAMQRGIGAERLIFAPRVKLDEHLSRHRLADLFLDTLPCNAHTTASDALWAGLPLVTCMGNTFASRVAGSLLQAVGLPELITHTLEDYENLAFKLATTPALLAEIKEKLSQNRLTYPLFNTDRFRHHLEAAYLTMWEIHQRGEAPKSFSVAATE